MHKNYKNNCCEENRKIPIKKNALDFSNFSAIQLGETNFLIKLDNEIKNLKKRSKDLLNIDFTSQKNSSSLYNVKLKLQEISQNSYELRTSFIAKNLDFNNLIETMLSLDSSNNEKFGVTYSERLSGYKHNDSSYTQILKLKLKFVYGKYKEREIFLLNHIEKHNNKIFSFSKEISLKETMNQKYFNDDQFELDFMGWKYEVLENKMAMKINGVIIGNPDIGIKPIHFRYWINEYVKEYVIKQIEMSKIFRNSFFHDQVFPKITTG